METTDTGRKPLVSICMPHLNSQPFLEERMRSILRQTLTDWELIIVDSSSDDGSREILQRYAEADSRIHLADAPRDGIYSNLNRAIERGRGKYVYIATSDDTMAADCLERMAAALEHNPDCGLCHCCLEIIDEAGNPVGPDDAWDNFTVQMYFGDWTHRAHIRRAPHDGLLHLGFMTIYTSLTQLLVRRRVFEDLGLFRTDCHSRADFEWGLRVGLNESVVHVPRKLATWRRHRRQATQPIEALRARARGDFRRMTMKALKSLENRNPPLAVELERSALHDFYLVDEVKARRMLARSLLGPLMSTAEFVVKHPLASLRWLRCKIVLRQKITADFGDAVRSEFQRLGLAGLIVRIDGPSGDQAESRHFANNCSSSA
jgi:glycosyltransferase involved in cell wall biosynthesis